MDKSLLEEVAKNNDLSETILKSLGEKNRWLDEMLSTMSPRWKSEKDHYRMLSRQIVSLATTGNVIIIGRGASIVTQNMKNCRHFRIYASMEFKTQSISRRAKISLQDAELLVEKKQKLRDKFIKDFLDQDARDLQYYNLLFNNDKNSADRIAQIIADYVTAS
jgi:cytidylate kinase